MKDNKGWEVKNNNKNERRREFGTNQGARIATNSVSCIRTDSVSWDIYGDYRKDVKSRPDEGINNTENPRRFIQLPPDLQRLWVLFMLARPSNIQKQIHLILIDILYEATSLCRKREVWENDRAAQTSSWIVHPEKVRYLYQSWYWWQDWLSLVVVYWMGSVPNFECLNFHSLIP